MKKIILAISLIFAVGCGKSTDTKTNPTVQPVGGVDVGNMTSAAVPGTKAFMSFPGGWSASVAGPKLSLVNKAGSVIQAKKAEITDLASPTAVSLQQYLLAKFPERSYKLIQLNGLEGVRAELAESKELRKSDVYLVSETKDFLHLETSLKEEANGIVEGETILSTVRVKYQGVPYLNAKARTVTLEARNEKGEGKLHGYAFWGDCFIWGETPCNSRGGVGVSYERNFQVGLGGYDHGRVVELGPESEIPFESIKVEGEYLVAPKSKVLISDIYTAFSPKNPQEDRDSMDLKEGHVYLVRTISWPEEDLITKMRVEKLDGGRVATLTYEKLVYVKAEELQKQVDAINQHTLKEEMPLSEGEVTLYSRSKWGNYFHASFNFQYSTSGNMFITRNSWDLVLSDSNKGGLAFHASRAGSEVSYAADLGSKPIRDVTTADFPDLNTVKQEFYVPVVKGHTYAVVHHKYGGEDASAVYGAVHVLDVGPNDEWVRLQFRRLKIGPAEYFQKWIPLSVPEHAKTVQLEISGNDWKKGSFYPYRLGAADPVPHRETISFQKGEGRPDYFYADSGPYGSKRGFFKLGSGIPADLVTADDLEALKGKYSSDISFAKGDVFAVLLENYEDRVLMVMTVQEHQPGQSVRLSIRYLARAKTSYAKYSD